MKKLFKPILKLYHFGKERVIRSVRLELVVTFGICLLAAFISGSWYNGYYKDRHMIAEVDYSSSIKKISNDMVYIKTQVDGKSLKDDINRIISDNVRSNTKIYLTDTTGKVLFKSNNAKDQKLNIYELIIKAENFKREYNKATIIDTDNGIVQKRISLQNNIDYVDIDGITLENKKAYLIITGTPQQAITYIRPSYTPVFSGIIAVMTFIFLFYFLTNKKMLYIEKVSKGLMEISKDNLDYRIELRGKDEIAKFAYNINFMADELKERIDKERAAEKTKNDLITNVSHDLRTPLTSIKGYLLLLKDKKYKDSNEFNDFVNISYNKSEKLESLINDLFEYTKLSNRVIKLNKEKICLDELLKQLVEELYIICKENNVAIEENMHSQNIYAELDGDKIVRVFENLLMNAVRYSLKPGVIKLKLNENERYILVTVENKCENINKDELAKIFNRFYRMDKSRSEATGGSGLGLAIAKNIVEMHSGEIWAESSGDNIVFFVKLPKI